jgi:hypothetical protein
VLVGGKAGGKANSNLLDKATGTGAAWAKLARLVKLSSRLSNNSVAIINSFKDNLHSRIGLTSSLNQILTITFSKDL